MERLFAKALWYWWIIVIVGFGLAGNAYMALSLLNEGEIAGAVLFSALFVGAGVLCYRTYSGRDEVRGIFRE